MRIKSEKVFVRPVEGTNMDENIPSTSKNTKCAMSRQGTSFSLKKFAPAVVKNLIWNILFWQNKLKNK